MCDFDQLSGCAVFRMGSTLAVASIPESLHTLIHGAHNADHQITQSRNQPQQDNQSKIGQECHDVSAQVVDNSLHVNENDVRDQSRPGTETVKGGERSRADNKK